MGTGREIEVARVVVRMLVEKEEEIRREEGIAVRLRISLISSCRIQLIKDIAVKPALKKRNPSDMSEQPGTYSTAVQQSRLLKSQAEDS